MTTENLASLTNDELAKCFMEVSLREDRAFLEEDFSDEDALSHPVLDDIARHRKAIVKTLDARGVDARRVLLPLLDHQNDQVRFDAAKYLQLREPERAFATLRELAAGGPGMPSALARSTLRFAEQGIGKPP